MLKSMTWGEKTIKAYITSIGELTTELCAWSLERNGFKVSVLERSDSLSKKLETIYKDAAEDFIRVDADVIPNKNLTEDILKSIGTSDSWWIQFRTYDWAQQDIGWGGVQFIKKEALPYLRENVHLMVGKERPESEMSRIKEFYSPRRFESWPLVMGIHNYKKDLNSIRQVKARRNQLLNYDFELAGRLNSL